MTEKEREGILQEVQEWEKDKLYLEKKKQLKQDKRKFFSKIPKISTSKLLILFLFLNCTAIELFTAWITIKSIELVQITMMAPDFSPLITLIGAVVSEVIGFAIYSIKAAKENTKNGITYELALLKERNMINEENNASG